MFLTSDDINAIKIIVFDKFRSARQSWWFEGPTYDFFAAGYGQIAKGLGYGHLSLHSGTRKYCTGGLGSLAKSLSEYRETTVIRK